jgi:glycosyltransferase involved in cell wall biosynthesis
MTRVPVSVIIPAYQAEAFVGDALESVLRQTAPPNEIIVVDDGSSDRTGEVASARGDAVTVLRLAHGGVGSARNAGVSAASQPFVALLDADDLWAPTKLERQVALLEDTHADVAFCLARNVIIGDVTQQPAMMAPLPSALLARRAVFDAIGLFDESLSIADWSDWYLRMTERSLTVAVVDEVLVERRVHGANIGIRQRDQVTSYARVLKASLDRRRATALGSP